MAAGRKDPVESRKEWIEGWNETMVKIWIERMDLLEIKATGNLLRSPRAFPVKADGRFYDITLAHSFLEYGLWQDMGTGREISYGNGGDVKCRDSVYRKEHGLDEPRQRGPKWGGGETSGKMREPRRWMSPKYYSSTLRLRDYMALSLGNEFKYMFSSALEAENRRYDSAFYKKKGYKR